ncbi:MAG: glycosyltransferase [Lachnospiraceae bacterium]|nr:glycosyltransferase [Lachnospiraceae bacterium]
MRLSVILPAYQEAENLKKILPRLNRTLENINISYEILVIDTIEPMDDAETICNANRCRYINRRGGNLYGDAMRTGFEEANGKYVVVMDSDGSHNPEDIKRFYDKMNEGGYDLIIGSRYCRGGKTENPFILKLMSRVLNITYKIVFGLKVEDVSDSFRMYKGDQLKSIKTECDNFDIVEEILILLNYTVPNFKAYEVPILFDKRAAGNSKRDLLKFIRSYLTTMNKLLKVKNSVMKRK